MVLKKKTKTQLGNFYKSKTREWFRKNGYACEYTEVLQGIYIPSKTPGEKGRILYRKKDLFGSDGIAMNGKEIIFWNSKGTSMNEPKSSNLYKGAREMQKYPFPDFVRRVLVVWKPRSKEPDIIKVEDKNG
jgi:hypothetical protein